MGERADHNIDMHTHLPDGEVLPLFADARQALQLTYLADPLEECAYTAAGPATA